MPMPIRPLPLAATLLVLAAFSTAACSTTTGTPANGGHGDSPAATATSQSGPPPATAADATGGTQALRSIAVGDSFAMQPGDSVAVPGQGELQYLRLVNDSRCQPGVQCIWEGDAEIAFRWQPAGGAAEEFSLHTSKRIGSNAHPLGGHTLVLESLAQGDAPQAQLKLEAAP